VARKIKEYNKLPDDLKGKISQLNNLSGKEWTQLSKSINTYGGPIAKKRKEHGAAFPMELARHFIKIYTNEHDTVLDPFIGVGTTADACAILNRDCIGFELNPTFYELAIRGGDPVDIKETEILHNVNIQIYNENCVELKNYVMDNSISLTLTSPPYSDLLHKVAEHFAGYAYEKNIYRESGRKLATPYSENDNDFGNLTWEEYQVRIEKLMKLLYDVTREGGFNVWVVRDYRDVQNHIPYINLHSKIIELATKSEWILVDIVIWDQAEQRKLVKLGGAKSRRFYFNIGYSFVLIFRKNIKGEKFINA
jgi:DNA modification methylase